MNILDYWPTDHAVNSIQKTEDGWAEIIRRRRNTFQGFAEIEAAKGVVSYPLSLGTPRGQEAARTLLFRVIEELMESVNSTTREHRLEEAIDSFNYLLSVLIMDPKLFQPGELAKLMVSDWPSDVRNVLTGEQIFWNMTKGLDSISVYRVVSVICGDLADTFRNRAWMNEAQALYFEGRVALVRAFMITYTVIMSVFDDWTEFVRYYLAKDNVLQFRLKSKY